MKHGSDTKGYVNLDYVVKSIMIDLKQSTFHNYQTFLHLAAEGFTELNMYITPNIKVEYLPISEAFTANLPEDFIDYTKVGILINGKVWTLTHNKTIALPRIVDPCGKTMANVSQCSLNDSSFNFPNWGFYFANHFRNGQYVGELFGLGGGFNFADFRIDHERRQIALSSSTPKTELILEYISSGIKADGSTVVPRVAVKTIKEYVHWKRVEYDIKVPMNERKNREQQYYIMYDKLLFFENSFTMSEYLDNSYKHSKSSPKR